MLSAGIQFCYKNYKTLAVNVSSYRCMIDNYRKQGAPFQED